MRRYKVYYVLCKYQQSKLSGPILPQGTETCAKRSVLLVPCSRLYLTLYFISIPVDGRVVKVMDFLKTRLLDTLSDQIRKIQKVSKITCELVCLEQRQGEGHRVSAGI